MGSRRIALALVSAFGLVVLLAAAAWACTSSANISLNVNNGKPGVVVDVSGSEFPSKGRTQVYWEPNAGERQLLFETDSSSFAQPITIPDDAPAGTHYVKAYGYGEDGERLGTATASYTVSHGTVAGQINDTDSGEGVHGAEVSVADGGEVVGTVQTEADGTYRIGDLEKGAYTVTVRRPGYQEASTQAEVRLGETSDVSFTLTRQPQDDASDSGSGDPQADGSQSGPEGSQTSEPEGAQSEQPEEDTSSRGTTLEGSSSGGPTPQESTAPEAGEPQQAGQPEQPAEDEPAQQAIEPEPERQSIGANESERQTVGGADSAGSGGGDTAANQPQSIGEPEPTGGQAQPSTGEPAPAADTASEPTFGEAPADQAVPEPEAAESENAGHPAVGPDADASMPAPSARSGAADLWSGLAAGDVATLGSDQPATGQSGETSQAVVLAVGLLGAGLLTLASGGAVAARRRRAPAEASTTPRSG